MAMRVRKRESFMLILVFGIEDVAVDAFFLRCVFSSYIFIHPILFLILVRSFMKVLSPRDFYYLSAII